MKPGAKTKAGKRVIQLMDETVDELLSHKKKVQSDKREAGELYNDLDLVVCTSLGTPVNPSNLRRSFNRQIKKANLKKIRFHDLRHSHATMLLQLNINPKVISERLGYAN
ncbi:MULTISPECIES: tyrosine-type recombinase/integrase [Bacillaceae]|uniref:Tyrosine-type recombinase/integrase n=1 Tax=Caldifermentibacillus hisashii TaxID=996558 RepID=A0ABU9JZZ2_9BACI|nr:MULTISPECIES: tyrosine-type recombinase/integrase [Bacillaceae]KIO65163.1 hypothetical protein B4065_1107 [Caldibacillus thermoamylovorans]MBU5342868.1 tyrosine-type recombinase/integrase [Caldifermentibacillus hisashii]MCM3056295.1 tyrosine-type recombinase/integrase [Caldibacillus thermoamylovorans]MCM3797947.1 tyrosine-type recombinase/integrase [Caldibacillus thermoamylovorans]PAC36483.1 hypothetical protein CEJ87_06420 [Caldifermentibacillus hisashii]